MSKTCMQSFSFSHLMVSMQKIYNTFRKYTISVALATNKIKRFEQNSSDTQRITHYENTPMQYTAIFHGCKNDNFQIKKIDNFLIFA